MPVQEATYQTSIDFVRDQWRLRTLIPQHAVRHTWDRSHNPDMLSPMLSIERNERSQFNVASGTYPDERYSRAPNHERHKLRYGILEDKRGDTKLSDLIWRPRTRATPSKGPMLLVGASYPASPA